MSKEIEAAANELHDNLAKGRQIDQLKHEAEMHYHKRGENYAQIKTLTDQIPKPSELNTDTLFRAIHDEYLTLLRNPKLTLERLTKFRATLTELKGNDPGKWYLGSYCYSMQITDISRQLVKPNPSADYHRPTDILPLFLLTTWKRPAEFPVQCPFAYTRPEHWCPPGSQTFEFLPLQLIHDETTGLMEGRKSDFSLELAVYFENPAAINCLLKEEADRTEGKTIQDVINERNLIMFSIWSMKIKSLQYLLEIARVKEPRLTVAIGRNAEGYPAYNLLLTPFAMVIGMMNLGGMTEETGVPFLRLLADSGADCHYRVQQSWSETRGYAGSTTVPRTKKIRLSDWDQKGIYDEFMKTRTDHRRREAGSGGGGASKAGTPNNQDLEHRVATLEATVRQLRAMLIQALQLPAAAAAAARQNRASGHPAAGSSTDRCRFFNGKPGSCRKGDACHYTHSTQSKHS